MTLFELFGLVVTLIAVLGYLNHRFLKWPETIGITALALVLSMGITGYGLVNPQGATWAKALRGQTEWWMFLHDKGAGYGPWSREGWGRTKSGQRKAGWKRRHRNADDNPPVAGVTKFPARPVFYITGSTEERVLDRIDLFLQSACDEVADGAA